MKAKVKVVQGIASVKRHVKMVPARFQGIHFAAPNYLFRGRFDSNSTIIDVGCAGDADFSVYMMEKYGVKSIGVDPTHKHMDALRALSQKMNGKFVHEPIAVSATDGEITFNESVENISGSILTDHKNIKHDTVKSYNVRSIGLKNLPAHLHLSKIEYIKLDLEGAEYDLLENLQKADLEKYEQIFIEFHHHAVPRFTEKETIRCAKKLESFGFKSFTIDRHNYLFYL